MKAIDGPGFNREVLESECPVYVCFTAPWCHTCYPACLIASDLVEEYKDQINFVEVDLDESPELAESYGIKAVPTVLIFINGEPVKRLAGYQEKSFVRDTLDTIASG